MKTRTLNLMILFLLTAAQILAVSSSAQAGGWGDDNRGNRRDSSGFWGRTSSGGMSRYPTTAEISQALYGTPPEPYDTSAGNVTPEEEAVQAG
jgi:hypothetical protein